MRGIGRGLPSPAMVVALIALSVALGGTGYAAATLPGATAAKTKRHTACLSNVTLCSNLRQSVDSEIAGYVRSHLAQLRGPTGANGTNGTNAINGTNGANGTNGTNGARGPSDVYQAANDVASSVANSVSLTLPSGSYAVQAKGAASNSSNANATISFCSLSSTQDPSHSDQAYATLPPNGAAPVSFATLPAQTVMNLPSGGTVTFSCPAVASVAYDYFRITAIQTATLH